MLQYYNITMYKSKITIQYNPPQESLKFINIYNINTKNELPGSPSGSHGSATASKMARSLNLIEPNWFHHQNKNKMQRQITFFFQK